MYVYTPDGTTIEKRLPELPDEHWEQTSLDPPRGTYHDLDDRNAAGWGYLPLVETERPDDTLVSTHVQTVEIADGTATVVWTERALTRDEIDTRTKYADLDNKRGNLRTEVATLRQWADDARSTTVTTGNAVATLNVIVGRLGTFFDRFADLIETQIDQ